MIGAASITIDLSEHQTQTSPPHSEIKKPISSTGGHKTASTHKISKENTRSLELAHKAAKNKVVKKTKTDKKGGVKNIKELVMAIISVMIFAAMALWHFNQD